MEDASRIIADALRWPKRPLEQKATLARARNLLNQAASGSPLTGMRHPLGFYCITLASDERREVRLHVWPSLALDARPHAPVHDHICDLASLVLLGSVTNRFFRATPDERSDMRLHDVEHDGLESRSGATGRRFRLNEILPHQTLYPGEAYTLQSGLLHDTLVAERGMTATLLVATKTSRKSSLVARSIEEMTSIYLCEPLAPAQCAALLRIVSYRCRVLIS